ncbi:MAG: hypothetical protein IJ337_08745, partial [Clostridia bacterium]|nr:hypothetical protein [Clostridia bacterium]
MVGREENLFTSSRSRDDQPRMEEERRLCYVGITRARERLYMSHASRRMLYNQIQFNDRSRFIDDIPGRVLEDISERRDNGFGRSGQRADWQSGQWRQPEWSKGSSFAQKQETGSAWKPRAQFGTA